MKAFAWIILAQSIVLTSCQQWADTNPINSKEFNQTELDIINTFIRDFDTYVCEKYGSRNVETAYASFVGQFRDYIYDGIGFHPIDSASTFSFMDRLGRLPENTLWRDTSVVHNRRIPLVKVIHSFPDTIELKLMSHGTDYYRFIKEHAQLDSDIHRYYTAVSKFGFRSIREYRELYHPQNLLNLSKTEVRFIYILDILLYNYNTHIGESSQQELVNDIARKFIQRRARLDSMKNQVE